VAGYAIVPDIDAPELTGTDIAVWAALCRFAQWELDDGKPVRSKPGTCFPSLTGLQQAAHCSKATICRTLQKLEKMGYIVRTQGDNPHGNTEYSLFPNRQGGSLTERLCSLTVRQGVSHCETGVVSQRDRGSLTVRHEQTNITNLYNKPIEQEEEVKAAAADHVSLGQVAEIWNAKLAPLGFPTVMKGTPARQRAFQARLNESPERHTLEWWRGLMVRIEGAEFLVNSAKEKARWLSFDWVLNENNLVKILEGRYDRRQEARGRDSPKREQEPPAQTWEEAVARMRQKIGSSESEEVQQHGQAGLAKVS